MVPLAGSPVFVVLHTGPNVAPVEYVVRVAAHLLAFGGIGATVLLAIRTIEAVSTAVSRRGPSDDER